MTQPFIGQIQPYGFNFAPKNWALCNGQILSIAQNTALFSLLGTTYGGNGQTTFALPNLQSRVPMHYGTFTGNTYVLGEQSGEEQVTLLITELPSHNHSFNGSSGAANAGTVGPNQVLATSTGGGGQPDNFYSPDSSPMQPLNPNSIQPAGGNQAHNNLQPYLATNWCICLYGIYPSRN